MRALMIAAGAALALSACGGGDTADDANMIEMDNMSTDQNAMLGNDLGGMDGNAATNATTENMMLNDLTSNDADTNLANGM